jgi:hypothetical protein
MSVINARLSLYPISPIPNASTSLESVQAHRASLFTLASLENWQVSKISAETPITSA